MSLILCQWLVSSVATILHNLLLRPSSLPCRCGLLLLAVYYALSLCQSVGLSQSWALQKWMNRSRCHLGCGPKKPCHGVHIPMHAGSFEREKVICMANNWLKELDQQFFYDYNGIRALEKCWTKCISVAGDCVEKWQNMMYISCD